MAAGAPRQLMNEWTTQPEEILETFAAEMRANMRHYSIWDGNYALIVPKQLREHLHAAGWSKTDIAAFIHGRARIRRSEWAEVGKGAVVRDRGDSEYSALSSPDHLLVIAAGGPAGGFGAVIPPWLGTRAAQSRCRSASASIASRGTERAAACFVRGWLDQAAQLIARSGSFVMWREFGIRSVERDGPRATPGVVPGGAGGTDVATDPGRAFPDR